MPVWTRKVPPNLGKVKAFQPKHRIAVTSAFLDLDTGISKQLDRSCLRLGRLGDSDDVELEFPIAAFTRTRCEQVTLDITLEAGARYYFVADGAFTIHLAGFEYSEGHRGKLPA
ncbi:hypothetical protein D9611_013496 [Ephemerocybe angulata]|nr:hypothetical protein D9611_013496 [Tulosesus angulatus]